MDYLKKMPTSEVNQYLPTEYAFICCASFERRCCTLPFAVDAHRINRAYVIRNIDGTMEAQNEDNFQKICKKLSKATSRSLHFDDSLNVMEELQEIVQELVIKQEKALVVDISTFTHEALLIFLKILESSRTHFESISLVYNGASEYASWLSKGCKEVRNVIGYPGIFNPAKKYHLVILTGFEWERATRLVDLLEPDIVSIGTGKEPTDVKHQKTMETFENEFRDWLGNMQGVPHDQFSFSCSDITSTIDTLRKIYEKCPTDNFIFVPLNTKLSTIALALVALSNPSIQVCYPIPEIYNTSYSEASENATIVDLLKIDELSEESSRLLGERA